MEQRPSVLNTGIECKDNNNDWKISGTRGQIDTPEGRFLIIRQNSGEIQQIKIGEINPEMGVHETLLSYPEDGYEGDI